jgi:long-subunit fatty acid transport protein
VFAFGYNRVTNFTTALSYDGYNAASSIIPWLYNGDVDYDLAYKTKLNNYYGYTPIQNRVQQRGDVRESGGLGNWAFSGAIDVEENISFGMTLNVISGEYNYVRNYIEEDLRNVYNDLLAPADSVYLRFNRFYYDTDVSAELSGVNILFGMMYRMNDQLRCGVTIKSPSMISVRESALDEGTSFFDKGETTKGTIEYKNDYGVSSSWVFGAGASFYTVDWILISGDVEYTDWSQLEWTDNAELEKDNILLKKLFRPVYNVRFGIELEIPSTDLRVRAGAILNQSPFAGDPAKYDTRMETFGLGMLLQNNVLVDLAVAYGQMEIYHNNYGTSRLNLSRTDEKITTADVKFSIAYRF